MEILSILQILKILFLDIEFYSCKLVLKGFIVLCAFEQRKNCEGHENNMYCTSLNALLVLREVVPIIHRSYYVEPVPVMLAKIKSFLERGFMYFPN